MRPPHILAAVWPERAPGRLASLLRPAPHGCRAALLGLPDDLGVQLNGGRPGARGGPAAFRAVLSRFGVAWDGLTDRAPETAIYDAGDVMPANGSDAAALMETHQRIEDATRWLHERGLVTLCIGGGHDTSLPAVRGASIAAGAPLGGINVDAHLDVRARVGSGMPFRALIEGGHLEARHFVELGLGRFSNDPADLAWIQQRGARLLFADAILSGGLDPAAALDVACGAGRAFTSIDLDALDQSAAPGVSAPNPLGLGVHDVARLSEAAGERPEVIHFDLMEYNPEYDIDGRTGRTAVLLLSYFLAGLGRRG